MLSASVAVHVIVVTPFLYGALSASEGSSLLTPTIDWIGPSSVAVATPGSTTASQVPMREANDRVLNAAEAVDGGAVGTVRSFGAKTEGAAGGEKRITSLESLYTPCTRELMVWVT